MEIKTIKIKYLESGLLKIEHIEKGDWIDLRIAEDVHLEPNEFKLIPLGVAMSLPWWFFCAALILKFLA